MPGGPAAGQEGGWPWHQHHVRIPTSDDVTATELLAPGIFPLSAVASVVPALPDSSSTSSGNEAGGSDGRPRRTAQVARAAAAALGAAQQWPWQRLWRAGASGQQELPVELLIRVEGKGLSNVTHAFVHGLPASSSGSGGDSSKLDSSNSSSKLDSSRGGAGKASGAAGPAAGAATPAAAVAVEILRQPPPPLPGGVATPRRRQTPLPLLAPLGAFLSW